MKKYLVVPIVLVLFLAVLVAWATYPSWMHFVIRNPGDMGLGRFGTSGDAYGALNTLFSGLAFAGIIVSIFLQSMELRETREELKAQKDQFVLQNISLSRQVFENTFFQLIHLHNEISGAMEATEAIRGGERSLKGRDALSDLFRKFLNKEHRTYLESPPDNLSSAEEFELFLRIYQQKLGHYFRQIYQILKFVDQSDVEKKRLYTNILRAQLSSEELGLLFFNCLSRYGDDKFRPMVEKYSIFEHLPCYPLFTRADVSSYKEEAFGDSPQWREHIASLRAADE